MPCNNGTRIFGNLCNLQNAVAWRQLKLLEVDVGRLPPSGSCMSWRQTLLAPSSLRGSGGREMRGSLEFQDKVLPEYIVHTLHDYVLKNV